MEWASLQWRVCYISLYNGVETREIGVTDCIISCYHTANKNHSIANLALSFARRGIRTGILDTDIFGPSIPTLLNLNDEPRLDDRELLSTSQRIASQN